MVPFWRHLSTHTIWNSSFLMHAFRDKYFETMFWACPDSTYKPSCSDHRHIDLFQSTRCCRKHVDFFQSTRCFRHNVDFFQSTRCFRHNVDFSQSTRFSRNLVFCNYIYIYARASSCISILQGIIQRVCSVTPEDCRIESIGHAMYIQFQCEFQIPASPCILLMLNPYCDVWSATSVIASSSALHRISRSSPSSCSSILLWQPGGFPN